MHCSGLKTLILCNYFKVIPFRAIKINNIFTHSGGLRDYKCRRSVMCWWSEGSGTHPVVPSAQEQLRIVSYNFHIFSLRSFPFFKNLPVIFFFFQVPWNVVCSSESVEWRMIYFKKFVPSLMFQKFLNNYWNFFVSDTTECFMICRVHTKQNDLFQNPGLRIPNEPELVSIITDFFLQLCLLPDFPKIYPKIYPDFPKIYR